MSPVYAALLTVHVLSAAVLFGTGMGIAFFMVWAHRTRDLAVMAGVSRAVVTADFVFTAAAVVIQPLSGLALACMAETPLDSSWLLWSFGLYLLTGACWLPVVAIQMRTRDLLTAALAAGEPVPEAYNRLFRLWFLLGWPAFSAVIAIYVLMLAKPVI